MNLFETWIPIEGWPYEVSSHGNIRRGEYLKKLQVNQQGYQRIQLSHGKKVKTFPVHRIVAKAFIANPGNLPQVNHKDGNKTNNNIENLEWVTRSENLLHAFAIGLISHKGELNSNRKLDLASAASIIKRWCNGERQKDLAAEFGVTQCSVSDICRGYSWAELEDVREFHKELRRVRQGSQTSTG